MREKVLAHGEQENPGKGDDTDRANLRVRSTGLWLFSWPQWSGFIPSAVESLCPSRLPSLSYGKLLCTRRRG